MSKPSRLLERLRSPGPKRILALDGGGIRAVISLAYLQRLENLLRVRMRSPDLRLSEYFDLIGGTSTGSIIAAALALGMEVREVEEKYQTLGVSIFAKKKGLIAYFSRGQKYDAEPLNEALQDTFGSIEIGDQDRIRTGLCIVTKRADTFSTWPIHNHPLGKFYEHNKGIPLWQAVRASCAAPTYFVPESLKVGQDETGVFIDGGVSMANNPALRLFLLATLRGYPFHWGRGDDKLMLVSIGTGEIDHSYRYTEANNANTVLRWASNLPFYYLSDATFFNQLFLQMISNSPTSVVIDREVGDLSGDSIGDEKALHYLRYNLHFTEDNFGTLGYPHSFDDIKKLYEIDNTDNMTPLTAIGAAAASRDLKEEHLPEVFDLKETGRF
jgi:patatin-like phospholipase/acyl hydrolase